MWQRGVGVLRGGLGRLARTDASWGTGVQLSGWLRVGDQSGWRESSLREDGHSASVHRVTLKSAPSLGVEDGFAGHLSGRMAGELPVPEQPSARGGSRGGGWGGAGGGM